MNTLKLYIRSSKMLLKGHMQYPFSFFAQTLGQIMMIGGELAAVLLIFDRFTALGRWSAGEILFFFGMMQSTFALVEFFGRGIAVFCTRVQNGSFDTILLRPRNTLVQVICSEMDPRRMGGVLVGIGAMVMAGNILALQWTGLKVLCLAIAFVGSIALVMGLFLVEAVMGFFSVKSIEVINILTYGGRAACQYPVDIYPKPLKALFLYVAPFALTLHMPVSYVLGTSLFGEAALVPFIAPFAGVGFFCLMLLLWKIGVRHYRSTGS